MKYLHFMRQIKIVFALVLLLVTNSFADYQVKSDDVRVDPSSFHGALSSADTTVQKALETLDQAPSLDETDPIYSAWNKSTGISIGHSQISDWATAIASFLTSESDPIYVASSWHSTTNNSSNWNTAYGWGNHSLAGYFIKSSDDTGDITEGSKLFYTDARARASLTNSVTGLSYDSNTGIWTITTGYGIPTTIKQGNWDTAYGWGNHAGLYDSTGTASGVMSTHNSAYNHSLIATALQSESDPVWSAAKSGYFKKDTDTLDNITTGSTNIHLTSSLKTNYDTAYSHSQVTTGNPHNVNKADVGLGNADNTSDANKPISSLTQTALDGKVDENAAITGSTKTKITYDAKGLVTSGDNATTADISDSTNKRYVTDVNLTLLGNTSGTNTGDESQTTIKTKLGVASSGVDGYLSGTDWATFNGKQAAGSYEVTTNKSTNVTTDGASDTKYPSVKAIKDYADGLVTGLLDYRGGYDASVNTFPVSGGSGSAGAVMKGDLWVISVAGTLGGAAIQVGDSIIANVDIPGQTAGNWNTLNTNLSYVPEDAASKVTSISGSSTDTQYPSAKLLYDQLALKLGASATAVDSSKLNGQSASYYQTAHANLASLAGLSYASASFVKMTAEGTFALDINTYSLSNHNHDSTYLGLHATADAVTNGVYTTGAGTVFLAPNGSAASLTNFPTLNQNTTGSAGSLKSPATTGLATLTGMGAGTTRVKTVRDADDTILELGGSYTPSGTWNWTNVLATWPTFNQNTSGNAGTVTNATLTTALTNNGGAGTLTWPAAGATLIIPAGGGTLGSAAFTSSTAYDVAGAAAAVTPATLDLVIGTDVQAYNAYLTTGTIGITIDGGGSAITTGSKGFIYIPFACTITSATLLGDVSGSIVIDVKKCAYGSFPTTSSIAASAKPTLSSAQNSQDTTLTGWTTSVSAGDVIEFVVVSCTTTTRANLILKVNK